jgi:hypothetical protein
VIRAALAIRRISMTRQDHLHAHFSSPLHNGIKVVYLEPEQYAVSVWPVITISDPTVVMLYFEAVQL